MIKTNIFKSNFMKAALFGLFISAFSTGVAFAETNTGKDTPVAITAESAQTDKELTELQAKIDQFVFVDHADEIKAKEFMVTTTGVIDGYVEVGILPYSEENAKLITDNFGTEKVKVVEGEDIIMYAFDEGINTDAEASKSTTDIQFDESIFNKLDEVNNLLFEVNAKDLESKGLAIMSTAATEKTVEIGILPFTKENADYIYELVGKDLVTVVEGKEPELMATSGMVTDPAAQTGEGEVVATAYDNNLETVKLTSDAVKEGRNTSPIIILGIVGVIVLLGGTAYVLSHKKLD